MPEHFEVMTWTCPICGKTYERRQDEKERRCSCGRMMEATIDFDDKDGSIILRRLED